MIKLSVKCSFELHFVKEMFSYSTISFIVMMLLRKQKSYTFNFDLIFTLMSFTYWDKFFSSSVDNNFG